MSHFYFRHLNNNLFFTFMLLPINYITQIRTRTGFNEQNTTKLHIHLYIFSSPLHQYLKLYLGQNIKKSIYKIQIQYIILIYI